MLNGHQMGHFRASNGFRRGDPLSPYLFLIGMEGLSVLLQKTEVNRVQITDMCLVITMLVRSFSTTWHENSCLFQIH